jgi:hypothetical protein
MLIHDLPSVLTPLIADGAPRPRLHCRVIFVHPSKAPEPVGKRQVTANENTKVTYLCPECSREAGQACFPGAAELIYILDFLERRFHVEDDGLRSIMAYDLIRVFHTNSAQLIINELPNLGFVMHFGGFDIHRHPLYFDCLLAIVFKPDLLQRFHKDDFLSAAIQIQKLIFVHKTGPAVRYRLFGRRGCLANSFNGFFRIFSFWQSLKPSLVH